MDSECTDARTLLDRDSERSWLELVRDIVAIANSGGGVLWVDLRSAKAFAGKDDAAGSILPEAELNGKLLHYAGQPVGELQLRTVAHSDGPAIAITVAAANVPIGFTQSGVSVEAAPENEHVVFAAGTFYFRHGDRSEPGTSDDLRAFFGEQLRRIGETWLQGIRRAVSDLEGMIEGLDSKPATTSSERTAVASLHPVRIVTDPAAPALQPQDVERLYPWRQKELVRELGRRLGGLRLNSYDIQAVRRHHRLDERPEFVFNLPGAGRRYSDAALDWFVEQQAQNPDFFREARAADQAMLKLRRQKPR